MLYHYTPPGGLLGIVRSRALWATGIRYLNDTTEYLHALHVARAVRRQMTWLAANEVLFFDYLLGEMDRQSTPLEFRVGGEYYVISLTEQPDRLSQWRAYAGRTGYCIGWETTTLQKLAVDNKFELQQCVYSEEHQRALISPILEGSLREFQASAIEINVKSDFWCPLKEGDLEGWVKLAELLEAFDRRFSRVAAICKNPAFAEEEEWRLIGTGVAPDGKQRPVEYREGRTQIIPYALFDMNGITKFLAPEERPTTVIIGPNPEPDLARRAIVNMFHRFGWGVIDLKVSTVPYRDW